jgi:hypothetical protein
VKHKLLVNDDLGRILKAIGILLNRLRKTRNSFSYVGFEVVTAVVMKSILASGI